MWRLISCHGTYSRMVPISNCNEKFGGHLSNYNRSVPSGSGVSLTLYHVNVVIKRRCIKCKKLSLSESNNILQFFSTQFNAWNYFKRKIFFFETVNFVDINFEAWDFEYWWLLNCTTSQSVYLLMFRDVLSANRKFPPKHCYENLISQLFHSRGSIWKAHK